MSRRLGLAVLAMLAVPIVYLGAALALGLVPVNRDFAESADGIAIYLRTNGVHAEIVVPTRAAGVDWSLDHPPQHFRRVAAPLPWIAFGWGDRDFYLNTPTWRELRFRTAFVALTGLGQGAMHVEYLVRPEAYASRRVRISAAQYDKLVGYLRGSFRRDARGRPTRIDAPGYFDTDAFYEAIPVYTFWFTCNDWVRRGLIESGLRAPAWSPFDRPLFWQLEKAAAAHS
jgi:uncharacterized protein (TIGR02117 family)